MLINNNFNVPSSSSININNSSSSNSNRDSCNPTNILSSNIITINSSKTIDIVMDQKKHINNSTSATVIKETETIKSEKIDIQTEPDSTTNGLSPDKSLILKTSLSNSDTGFGSGSSFCSSNSSNSSCISNESTNNNNYKQQKIYKFAANMDVLVQKKDGKFYLGIIKYVYAVDGKCLINFDDSSEYLADFDELKRLGTDSDTESSPMCVICKKYDENDVVESCEKCLRGYHRTCAEGGFKNGIWTCKMCATKNILKTPEKKPLSLSLNHTSKEIRQIGFPYNINSLAWDNKHRINNEEIYCYCGKYGRWDNKMLQCSKCLQWFHEKCIKCLLYPLLYGDRFYVFECSVCNYGTEIIRRLKLSWVDLVHLLLFNLTKLENNKKYHHVTKVITPYALQNWPNLQLTASMNNLSHKEIQKKIIDVLSNSSRFKGGKETKKGVLYWGLRTRLPPSAARINVNLNNHNTFLHDGNKSIDLSSKLVALKKSSVNLFNSGLPSDFQAAGQFRIVRTIKRRLSAKDLVIGPNQEIKKRRLRRSSGSGNVEVISTSIQSVSSSKSKNNILATYPIGAPFNFNSISNLSTSPILSIPSSTSLAGSSAIYSISGTSATSPTSIESNNNPFQNFSNITTAQHFQTNHLLQKQRSLRKRDDKNYAENRRNSTSCSTNNHTQLATNHHLTSINTSSSYSGTNGCNIVSGGNGGESNRNSTNNNNNSFEQSTENELSDLQSSVNMYFGAVERIRNGEKFIVRGRRTLANGKIQYLMEWEGCAQVGQ